MTWVQRLGGREAITAGIVAEFRALSARPHGSGREEAQGAYLLGRLERMGLTPQRDGAGNVTALVPATPGREHRPRLILQGHMDMVCAVRPGSGFDPVRDAPVPVVEGGFLRSDGRSSLGADNNLGNAAVLWLLEQGVPHGPLRLLFTVAEEEGLAGAAQVDPAWLSDAAYLLNTDGFHLGMAVAGSAGGRRETYARPLELCAPRGEEAFLLSIRGGKGGHSGDDIHRGRMNAARELGAALRRLAEALPALEIAHLAAGSAYNAIPAQGEAVVVLPSGRWAGLEAARAGLEEELHRWYGAQEPQIQVTLEPCPLPEQVWQEECTRRCLALMGALFDGVYAMHPHFPGVVGASANLGRVGVEDGLILVQAFVRCARREEALQLFTQHDQAARNEGFTLHRVHSYPGWPGGGDNPLVEALCRAYRRETGREMTVTAVHVGLEPSVLGEKNPSLHMASTGPDILDAHSVWERAPLDSLPDYAALLAATLDAL